MNDQTAMMNVQMRAEQPFGGDVHVEHVAKQVQRHRRLADQL